MRFEIRRIYSNAKTIGILLMRSGFARPLMGRDYFRELPRGRAMPVFTRLDEATLAILPYEVLDVHPDARLGEIEISPDLVLPDIERELIPGQAEILALMEWLRDGAPA